MMGLAAHAVLLVLCQNTPGTEPHDHLQKGLKSAAHTSGMILMVYHCLSLLTEKMQFSCKSHFNNCVCL